MTAEKREMRNYSLGYYSSFVVHQQWVVVSLLALLFVPGCRQDMTDQPRYEPLEASTFFADGRAARPLVQGTVARGQLHANSRLYTGKVDNSFIETVPFAVTYAQLQRGRERYDIYCAPCHSRTGNGDGIVVRRGFRRPPSLHIERLRRAPVGYYFDVITSGFGVMPDYAGQISARDRWAIIAYIRALQLSQHASLADVPKDERSRFE
jgi:mono/diheme cytochrome c family protein